MSSTTSAQSTGNPGSKAVASVSQTKTDGGDSTAKPVTNDTTRYQLARLVLVGGFLTIFLLVATMLALAQLNSRTDMVEKAFTVLIPVLASWVGTVLAFFFSAQSQERTSNILNEQLKRTADAAAAPSGGGAKEDQLVTNAMIRTEAIRKKIDLSNPENAPGKLTVGILSKLFGETKELVSGVAPGPAVSRIMFMNGATYAYVMHESTLNAYWRLASTPAADQTTLTDPSARTLQEMLDAKLPGDPDRSFGALLNGSMVVQPGAATLRDAKKALDSNPVAQDIVVTATGKRDEPLLGWLTNVDLLKQLNGA